MTSLSRSCHLYGRRLVLSWAEKSGKDNAQLEEEVEKRRGRARRAAGDDNIGHQGQGGGGIKKGIKRYFDKSGQREIDDDSE